jgi:hypothetical protein
MRKDQMVVGAVHAVQFPAGEAHASQWAAPQPAKATVLEVGVVFERRYSTTKTNGVRCRLEAPLRTIAGTRGDDFRAREAGEEFIVESRYVLRPWGEWTDGRANDDDAAQAAREARYALQDELRERLARMGGAPAKLMGGEAVFALEPLVRWLRRIDPVVIAGQAIGLFEEELARFEPGDDPGTDAAKVAALREIEQGVAVSDAEITVEEGAG